MGSQRVNNFGWLSSDTFTYSHRDALCAPFLIDKINRVFSLKILRKMQSMFRTSKKSMFIYFRETDKIKQRKRSFAILLK